jgi:flagellar basal body rod protein FlgG
VQPTPADTTTTRIEQGAVEKSNVRGVVEMSRMIEITRSYTQVAAMLQQQADLGQTSIDKLADVPT